MAKEVVKKREQKLEVQPFGVSLNHDKIVKTKEKLGLNIAKLAVATDLSISFVQQVLSEQKCKGLNPSLGAIVALAGALGLKVSDVLVEVELKEHKKSLQYVQDLRSKGRDKSYRRDFSSESLPTWAGKVKV